MAFLPEPVRVQLPELAPPATRTPFPIVATLAPLAVAGVAWLITQSPFALLFALLGPVVAVAGVIDARVQARRTRREHALTCADALDRIADELTVRAEHARIELAHRVSVGEESHGSVVRIGDGDLPDRVELVGAVPGRVPPGVREALERVQLIARVLVDAPILADVSEGVAVLGASVAAHAVARSVALQLPGPALAGPAGGAGVVISLETGEPRITRPHEFRAVERFRPAFVTALQDEATNRRLRELDGGPRRQLPDEVDLAELLESPGSAIEHHGLATPIGHDGTEPIWLDLVAQGPHALVAGTTGSGKSELLVSWVVGIVARHRPDEVTFLLVDFKGGAAFAPLAGLPHVLGILSDLDDRLTARAVESLAAELRRRERVLADRGVRSIELLEPGVLARLVIVVDEFAAVVGAHPELHAVFTDLAARGRSLGLHLVLCTQRPAGIVRDAVLANVTLRISLRVTDRGDAIAVTGSDAASALPARPRGRAVVVDGEAPPRIVQLALATTALIDGLAAASIPADPVTDHREPGDPSGFRPWRDPLPRVLPFSELPESRDGVVFGRADIPAEQRQPVVIHDPARHGALLVVGATGAGKTTALTTCAAAANPAFRVGWLPEEPADAWQVLTQQLTSTSETPRLLVIDDLDLLLSRFDADYRPAAIELLARALREGPRRGLTVIAATSSITGAASLANAFGSRLTLRAATRDEHVLAGATGASFDPDAAPGSGNWRGLAVQVAIVAESEPAAQRSAECPRLRVVPFDGDEPVALVSGRPRETRALLADTAVAVPVSELSAGEGLRATGGTAGCVLGDPDSWLAAWERLGAARRDGIVVLHNCSIADHRALTRARELPPPLGSRPGECWLVRDGVTERALLVAGAGDESARSASDDDERAAE